jgi:signal transduction histidine kinase/CheY-like chemotaxis protein
MKMNTRILVIDDEENVRDSMRAMLTPRQRDTSAIDAVGERLFDGADEPAAAPPALPFHFEVDTTHSGREGLRLVREALASGRPYAVLFVDMRMPGWDGLTTVQHIREYDRQIEVIFVTAYSDYSVREIVARAGMNVSYHCKPFSSEELQQLAIKSVYDWNKARQLEQLMAETGRLDEIEGNPENMLPAILRYVCDRLPAQCALFAEPNEKGEWDCFAQAGKWSDALRVRALECAARHSSGANGRPVFEDACFCRVFDRFVLAAYSAGDIEPPSSEALYMVHLFLEQARQALDKARLRHTILQKEKNAAIGAAIGMVLHDLRSPIGAIQSACEFLLNIEPGSQAEPKSFIQAIRSSADQSMNYVQDLLEFIRGEKVELVLHPVTCRAFLEELAEEACKWTECAAVEIVVKVSDDAAFMMDKLKMRRLMLNLVKNAAEALRDYPSDRAPRIILSGDVQQGKGRLTVRDNGPGLPRQVRERLFELFNTVNKSGGTGLGLAIVKKFADAHGLEITADSDRNGTCFVLAGLEVDGTG